MKAILGTILDGDLKDMAIRGARGPLGPAYDFGLTWEQLSRHLVIIGGTGTGKTVTQLRLASSIMGMANCGELPIRILFLDAKGLPEGHNSDKRAFLTLAENHDYHRVYSWPDIPLKGFEGTVGQVRERLSGLFDSAESAYHHAESVAMLDLALRVSNPPRSLDELIKRVRPGVTANLYETQGTIEGLERKAEAAGFTNAQWNALYLRLRALQATVGTTLDSRPLAWEIQDVDAAWLSIPGTSSPQTAADVSSWLLALIAELAVYGDGRRTVVFLDEFSAIGQDLRASRAAASLIERTRAANVALVIGSQTVASLGESAERLLQTAGTILCHRTPLPDDLVALAGTVSAWEDTQEVDSLGIRRANSGRLQQQFRVNPDLVRQLPVGECVAIHSGRWAHIAVAEPNRN